MKFRTELSLAPLNPAWTHTNRFALMGSCFSDEIGRRLQHCLFACSRNPFGTVFNPLSISRLLNRSIERRAFEPSEFFEQDGTWRHFDIHSSQSAPCRQESCDLANQNLQSLNEALAQADTLILTLGTAWSYRHRASGVEVGHNHRLNLSQFDKQLLSVEEIVDSLGTCIQNAYAANGRLSVVLSVSPVRHLRDGLHENNLSKSTLLLAVAALRNSLPRIAYFPAYELLIDDLRDYRFYADDLTHPSSQAVEYIWSALRDSWMSGETRDRCLEIESVLRTLRHRPQRPDSAAHRELVSTLESRIEAIAEMGLDVRPLQRALTKFENNR